MPSRYSGSGQPMWFHLMTPNKFLNGCLASTMSILSQSFSLCPADIWSRTMEILQPVPPLQTLLAFSCAIPPNCLHYISMTLMFFAHTNLQLWAQVSLNV